MEEKLKWQEVVLKVTSLIAEKVAENAMLAFKMPDDISAWTEADMISRSIRNYILLYLPVILNRYEKKEGVVVNKKFLFKYFGEIGKYFPEKKEVKIKSQSDGYTIEM